MERRRWVQAQRFFSGQTWMALLFISSQRKSRWKESCLCTWNRGLENTAAGWHCKTTALSPNHVSRACVVWYASSVKVLTNGVDVAALICVNVSVRIKRTTATISTTSYSGQSSGGRWTSPNNRPQCESASLQNKSPAFKTYVGISMPVCIYIYIYYYFTRLSLIWKTLFTAGDFNVHQYIISDKTSICCDCSVKTMYLYKTVFSVVTMSFQLLLDLFRLWTTGKNL